MNELDLATLSLAITLAAFVCAAMMFAIWRINCDLPGIREWMLASVVHGSAFLTPFVAAALPSIPRYWFTALNNTLTLTALMLALEGSLRFRGYQSAARIHLLWLLVPLFAAMSVINMQSAVPRYLFHDAVAVSGLTAITIVMIWRNSNKDEKKVHSLMAIFAGVLAVAFMLRWLTAFSLEPDAPASSIPVSSFLYIAIMLYTLGWTLSAILACYYRANRSLLQLAREDSLTGLPNRRCIDDELGRVITQSRRSYRNFMLMVLDLNGFKNVNDEHGHAVGDKYLQAVAARLQKHVRTSDFVGRLGGDEFVIIAHEPGNNADALRTLERLRSAINGDVEIDGKTLAVHISAGMAYWPDDGETADELMTVADRRMYQDKPVNRQLRASSRPPALNTRV